MTTPSEGPGETPTRNHMNKKLTRYAKTRIRESLDDILMQYTQLTPGPGRRDALTFIKKEIDELHDWLFQHMLDTAPALEAGK